MELTFTYKPELKLYIAEFRADKEFNIHIERPEPGYISMQQNSAEGGKYAAVDDWGTQNNDKLIIDYESGYFVTPKFIKIISKVLPTYAAITAEGDVVEIKSQVKSIEITSNGTTSVEPDAGFSYLSKIDVKTNVPQSGGGEGGGSANIEYLDLRGYDPINDRAIVGVIGVSLLWNALNNGVSLIGPVAMITSVIQGNLEKLQACAVDFSVSLSIGPSGILTAKDFILQGGVSEEAIASIPRITKEEFYNLES